MKPDIQEAIKWLNKAIERHDRHIMGDEPTTGKDGQISQILMMEEMKMARRSIIMGEPIISDWYKEHAKKMD